jgi:hypothetical protein
MSTVGTDLACLQRKQALPSELSAVMEIEVWDEGVGIAEIRIQYGWVCLVICDSLYQIASRIRRIGTFLSVCEYNGVRGAMSEQYNRHRRFPKCIK